MQGVQIPEDGLARANEFCVAAPNICGPSILNLFHVALPGV